MFVCFLLSRAVNFPDLEVDFAVCSGHKMCAPTGIGFLWGKLQVLEEMPPFMGGGEMIQDVFEGRFLRRNSNVKWN